MIIIAIEILFFCLFSITWLSQSKPVDIETVRSIRTPQIQKLFIENTQDKKELEDKFIISSTRIPSWEVLDENLEPNQKAIDFSDILHSEQDPFKFNFFLLSNDRDIPMWKPSDPNFVMPFGRQNDLLNFQFDPPFLNFTESTLFVTSVKSISLSNLSDKFEIKIVSNKTDNAYISVIHDESFTKVVKPGIKHKLKVAFTPATLKNIKALLCFTVNLIQIDSREVVDTLYFTYEVFASNIANPFGFDPLPLTRVFAGESWETLLAIYNPTDNVFIIKEVSVDDEDFSFKVPLDVNTILQENGDDVQRASEGDMSVIWKILPNKKQKFLHLEFSPRAPGIRRIALSIETSIQNFTLPLTFKVKPKALLLNKELYDLGVVTNPRIPHEVQLNITNRMSYPIQIIDIYALVPQDTRFRIFQLENKVTLAPLEESKLVAKIRLLPVIAHKSRGYEGKFFIQTNDTTNGQFIESKYRFSYHKDLLHASSESEVSFFVRMQGDNIYTDKKDSFHYVEDKETGGILELVKTVNLVNRFYSNLELQRIYFPTQYLSVKGVKSVIQLPMRSKEKVFELILRIPIQDLNMSLFNSWIGMDCYGMIVPLHVNIYDKRLHCSMNIDGEEKIEKCSNMKDVSLNFGFIASNEVRTKTLVLKNYNPFDITIVAVNCTIPNCYTEVVEASLDKVINEKDEIVMKDRKIFHPANIEKPVYRGLGQYHKAAFSFRVDKTAEEVQKGEIKIQTIDEIIKIPISYQIIEGNLTFTPQIVRFQPAFPGKKQEAKVIIKNMFNTVVKIKQIESENPEIIPTLTHELLNPYERVEAFKITFDPSKNKQVTKKRIINFLNTANSSGPYIYGITLDDLYSWREAKNVWDELTTSSSTEIRDWVRIVNDVSERTFVQVRASLTNPMLIKESLNFGVTKVHSRAVKNITIENPSDLPIYVQLFLGPEEFSNPTFVSQMFKTYPNEESVPVGESKHIFCLIDFMFQTTDDDGFVKAFLEDKTFQRYTVEHVNLGILDKKPEGNEEIVDSRHKEDIGLYANKTYQCVEGNMQNIDALILNYTEKFTKRLIQEEDKSNFDALHFQNFKETPIYEIKAMSFASPKPMKENYRAQTVFEKIINYFQSWFDFEEASPGHKTSAEQSALMEKLKQNIKEIYIQNFNSLQKDQQIFLDPKYRDLSIFIPPHSDITIPALIHQPTSNKEYDIMLYVKNNLTTIFQIPVKGTGGSGNLLVTDVKRFDYQKKNFVRSTEEMLEGDLDNRKMKFYIDKGEIPLVDAIQCLECPPGTKKLRLDKPFRRKFTLKNDGNLPLEITSISIQNLGCEGYGFKIEECEGFILDPNQEQDLEIKFVPDMSLTYFTRALVISTNQGNFEFEIQVKMPFKNLYDNFDIYHLKSRIYLKIVAYVIIIIMAAVCFKLINDAFFGKQSKRRKRWQVQGQENLNYLHPNEIFENIISVKQTFTPVLPAAKILVPKKAPAKVEKNPRTSKTPIKQNEFKEEISVNLNKFEDSENDAGEIKVVGATKRKSQRQKKEVKPPSVEETKTPTNVQTPTIITEVKPKETTVQPELAEPVVTTTKPAVTQHLKVEEKVQQAPAVKEETAPKKTVVIIKEKKPYEKRVYEKYEKKPYERKPYEKRGYEKQFEKKQYEKKKPEPNPEEINTAGSKATETAEIEKKAFESELDQDQDRVERQEEFTPKESNNVEVKEEKKSDSNQQESPRELFNRQQYESKHSMEPEEEESDEDLEGDILDDEAKNVVESIIGKEESVIGNIGKRDSTRIENVGHIGSRDFAPAPSRPQKTQAPTLIQSVEHSEVTSEDDAQKFYNYFGNYRTLFMPSSGGNQHQDNSRFSNNNQYGSYLASNNDILANTPGLGLFQTKRNKSRYDQSAYFPPSTSNRDRNIDSPRRGPNVNKPAFFTGSEDESGVISESSVSSKPFYNQNDVSVDEEKLPERTFNIPNENNPFSFAQIFFPNLQNVSKPAGEGYNVGGFDEKNLNYFFDAGIRFRNLKVEEQNNEPDSSELPPGLH